jgi:hypothetical protein
MGCGARRVTEGWFKKLAMRGTVVGLAAALARMGSQRDPTTTKPR